MTLPYAKDLAYRRLRDYVSTCKIIEVYVSLTEGKYIIVVDNDVDIKRVSGTLWRCISEVPVDVRLQKSYSQFPTDGETYVCYQNERWCK